MTDLTIYLGDSKSFDIDLEWDDAAFAPGTDWILTFTAKTSNTVPDTAAKIQKTTGAGITATGSSASVALVRNDTNLLTAKQLVWDVKARHYITNAVRTVASGRLILTRGTTREILPAVDIITTEPPLPGAGLIPAWLAEFDSISITAGDDLELVQGDVTYYVPLYRRD